MNIKHVFLGGLLIISGAIAQDAYPIRCAEGLCIMPESMLEKIAERMESLFADNERLRTKTGCL